MTHSEMITTLKEIMERYDEMRNHWITQNGSDKGFDKWFTEQVIGK